MALPRDKPTTEQFARAEEFQRPSQKAKKTQPSPDFFPEEAGGVLDERFSERVVAEALKDLFMALEDDNENGRHIGNCEINLGTLQRMNIHAIQRELIQLTSEIVRTRRMTVRPRSGPLSRQPSQALELRELMKEYCETHMPRIHSTYEFSR